MQRVILRRGLDLPPECTGKLSLQQCCLSALAENRRAMGLPRAGCRLDYSPSGDHVAPQTAYRQFFKTYRDYRDRTCGRASLSPTKSQGIIRRERPWRYRNPGGDGARTPVDSDARVRRRDDRAVAGPGAVIDYAVAARSVLASPRPGHSIQTRSVQGTQAVGFDAQQIAPTGPAAGPDCVDRRPHRRAGRVTSW